MAMPAPTQEWTAEMARELPEDGNRYEVLDGELFVTATPSAPHQRSLRVLLFRLAEYVREHAIGEVLWSPADIEFSPRRLVQPDLFVAALVDGRPAPSWKEMTSLVLAIEALSPSTAYADRLRKRHIYMEENVGEYWIVDLDARVIERWKKGDERPEICVESLAWQPLPHLDPLTIDVTAYFAEVLGN